MDDKKKLKNQRWRRRQRVREKIYGTPDRPRLNVYRSNKHIYAQIIDDLHGHTLAASGSLDPELREELEGKPLTEKAWEVGKKIAEECKKADIDTVVFDRSRFKYHGSVKKLAEGAREGGLKF